MISLLITNNNDSEEFEFKNRYLVGSLENFVEKFLNPILSNLNFIVSTNKVFRIQYHLGNLKKFIYLNKHKFTSKEKINSLEKFIRLLS
jgi:hypothetical protein